MGGASRGKRGRGGGGNRGANNNNGQGGRGNQGNLSQDHRNVLAKALKERARKATDRSDERREKSTARSFAHITAASRARDKGLSPGSTQRELDAAAELVDKYHHDRKRRRRSRTRSRSRSRSRSRRRHSRSGSRSRSRSRSRSSERRMRRRLRAAEDKLKEAERERTAAVEKQSEHINQLMSAVEKVTHAMSPRSRDKTPSAEADAALPPAPAHPGRGAARPLAERAEAVRPRATTGPPPAYPPGYAPLGHESAGAWGNRPNPSRYTPDARKQICVQHASLLTGGLEVRLTGITVVDDARLDSMCSEMTLEYERRAAQALVMRDNVRRQSPAKSPGQAGHWPAPHDNDSPQWVRENQRVRQEQQRAQQHQPPHGFGRGGGTGGFGRGRGTVGARPVPAPLHRPGTHKRSAANAAVAGAPPAKRGRPARNKANAPAGRGRGRGRGGAGSSRAAEVDITGDGAPGRRMTGGAVASTATRKRAPKRAAAKAAADRNREILAGEDQASSQGVAGNPLSNEQRTVELEYCDQHLSPRPSADGASPAPSAASSSVPAVATPRPRGGGQAAGGSGARGTPARAAATPTTGTGRKLKSNERAALSALGRGDSGAARALLQQSGGLTAEQARAAGAARRSRSASTPRRGPGADGVQNSPATGELGEQPSAAGMADMPARARTAAAMMATEAMPPPAAVPTGAAAAPTSSETAGAAAVAGASPAATAGQTSSEAGGPAQTAKKRKRVSVRLAAAGGSAGAQPDASDQQDQTADVAAAPGAATGP